MKIVNDGYNYVVRLDKGEKLVESLEKYFSGNKIAESYWISGLGAAVWAELGFYDLEKQEYMLKKIVEPLEITALTGNIAWDGDKVILHIHGSFSDKNMKALGGHVKELEVAGTCEMMLHKWYQGRLGRKHDDSVGLNLLDL